MTPRPRLILLLLTLALSQTLAAQDWNELRRVVRDELAVLKAPGAAIAVIRDNRVVFAEGFGSANVATGVRVTPQTRFRIGSLVKMFTATAILSEPRLKLDVPVSTYAPELPPRIGALTLEQLLTHQGGLVDRLNDVKLSDEDAFTEPGRILSYSSVGYAVAGRAAAAAAGVPFDEFLGATFEKYGMTATSFNAGPADTIGYRLKKDRPVKTEYMNRPEFHPAGFLYSNLDDLSRFAIAFMSGEIAAASALSKAPVAIPGETARRYGYGTFVLEEGGEIAIYHNGDEPGGSSTLKMIPAKKCAVIVLTNLMGRMPKSMAAALRLAGAVDVPEPAKTPHRRVTRDEARELAGTYWNYNGVVIQQKGDTAILKPWFPWFAKWIPFRRELVSYGNDEYGIVGTTLGPEPLKFKAIRGPGGDIEFLFIQGRAYKRR
jgi:CubicO group peptidase (beta-lactamase class C family)